MKVTHFVQVINFREMPHGKIHPSKVDKNNRESAIFTFFFFFFDKTLKQSLLSLLFCRICFSNELFTHALAKGADHIIKQTKQSQNEKQTFFERL